MHAPRFTRTLMVTAIAAITFTTPALAQHDHMAMSTPEATSAAWSCDTIGTPVAASHDDMAMDHGDMDMDVAFDQLYIDMMLPHHGSIIALAEAALPSLTDPRLIALAEDIITNQTAEQATLQGYREAWFGAAEPDLSEHSMMLMLDAMPVGTMDEMMHEMDAATQVATFCAADDPDLAFIEQTIPHHQMAVDVSVIALVEAEHPELVTFAEGVIVDQQAEIDLLTAIAAERTGAASATPAN